jgi:hypothetical protein
MTRKAPRLLLFEPAERGIAMRKANTHFEQIPVELVKKIAKEDVPDDNVEENDGAVIGIAATKLRPHRLPSLGKNGKRA